MTGQDSVRARSFGKRATRDRASRLRPGALFARNLRNPAAPSILVLSDEAFGLSQGGATPARRPRTGACTVRSPLEVWPAPKTRVEEQRMTTPFLLHFEDGQTARAVRVDQPGELVAALGGLGLQPPRPVVVVVGGAGGLGPGDLDRLRPLFESGLIPVITRLGVVASMAAPGPA